MPEYTIQKDIKGTKKLLYCYKYFTEQALGIQCKIPFVFRLKNKMFAMACFG